jgi:hypothetical protein
MKDKKDNKFKTYCPLAIIIILIAVPFIAHLYNLSFLIVNGAIMNQLFLVSLSVIMISMILFILIYERRKFAVKLCVFLYAYIILVAISFFFLNRLPLIGLIIDCIISIIIVIYALKSKFVKHHFVN